MHKHSCVVCYLEHRLHTDVANHGPADERSVPLVRPSVKEFHGGSLGPESEGAHGVHDEVNPEHHERVEGRVLTGESTDEHNQESHHCICI